MTHINELTPDSDLLREVAVNHGQEPFRLLVSRYVDLVHSAATRQIRDPNSAEDVTQAVFLLLWQRAGALQSSTQLGGWLLVATRNIARNLIRHEERLKRRECKVAMMIRTDGTMRADNVEPGTYQCDVTLREPYNFSGGGQNLLGSATISFIVPTTPACPTDEPLDIGVIHLTAPMNAEIGKPLPNIQLEALDGKPVNSSDWSGKIVVLHLWEMHNRKFFPVIHQLAEKFKDDPRIQIVNVAAYTRPDWVRHIDAEDRLPGLLALYKDSSDWDLMRLPFVLIIDAHGKVIAQVSDEKDLLAEMENAAGK